MADVPGSDISVVRGPTGDRKDELQFLQQNIS